MSEWTEISLRDICTDISYGYTASATSEDTGVKFLRITDIVNSPFSWDTVPFCQISKKDAEKYKLFTGDIVIARTGATTGTTYTIKDQINSVYASYLIRYKIDRGKANPLFIGYNLQSDLWKGYVENIIGGSAQPGANAQQFANYELLLPPLPEQERIAEVLSSLDDKIDLLHKQNQTLEQLAETMFRQWFVETDQEAVETTLSSLYKINIGRTPPRKESEWFTLPPHDVMWVSIKDMGNAGTYVLSTAEHLTSEAIDKFNIPLVPKNTVILSFKLTVGRVCITPENLVTNEAIASFTPKDESSPSTEFLYLFLKQFNYDQLGSTSSIAEAVNSQTIKDIVISLPSKPKLESFTGKIQPLFKKIKNNSKQIKQLEQTRNTLLPKLMSGTVRVNN